MKTKKKITPSTLCQAIASQAAFFKRYSALILLQFLSRVLRNLSMNKLTSQDDYHNYISKHEVQVIVVNTGDSPELANTVKLFKSTSFVRLNIAFDDFPKKIVNLKIEEVEKDREELIRKAMSMSEVEV